MKNKIPDTLDATQKNFLQRVYKTPAEVYISRLKAIGFTGKELVLDAGCGFGQWSLALSQLNKKIVAIDADKERIETAKIMAATNKFSNINFQRAFIQKFDTPDNSFDAIFSYSVLYITQEEKSIANLSRLLKKGGKIYLNFNSYGIIPFILVEHAIKRKEKESFLHTIQYLTNLFRKNKKGLHALSVNRIIRLLEKNNMKIIALKGDGEINFTQERIKKFYPATYWGMKNVVEILAEKI